MSVERLNEHAWGKRWIAGLERLATAWQSRLPRGRDYAQKGHVVSLSVTPGRISARVQGSRSKPYTTTIDVPVLREGDWAEVTRHIAREARYAAELIAGGMPEGIEQLVQARGVNLFPVRNSEMIGACNCPDKARPCKHIAAIHYAFGEALDRDPYLLLTLRGADRRELVKGLRKLWLGVEEGAELDNEDDPTSARGMPVMPLQADRFNRSPDTIEQMSFSMRAAEQPLFILGRLGAPASWSLPVPIAALLGPVYEDTARRALEIAMAEPLREDLTAWSGDDEDDEWNDDLDDSDDGDEDEDDEADEDGDKEGDDADWNDGDDDEASWSTPAPVESRYRALDFTAPPLPGSTPSMRIAEEPAGAAAFVLPRSLSRLTATETPSVREEAAEPEAGAVLIRKGVAALSKTRRKQKTSGSLRIVSQSEELRSSLVTGDVPAVPSRPGMDTPPARVAAGSTFSSEPVIFETHASRGARGATRGAARAKAGKGVAVVETVVRTRGRAVDPPSASQPAQSAPSPSPAPLSTAPPLVRRAVPAADVRPVAERSAAGTGPVARVRSEERVLAPQGPRGAARTLDENARRAFERGEGQAALEPAREAWRLEPSEARCLMLMAAADLAGTHHEVLDAEADRILDSAPTELRPSQVLLLLAAGRVMVVADWMEGVRSSVWEGEDALGDIVVPFALVAATDGAELQPFRALLAVWNRLASRGEKAFPDLEEPPAPAGAWLDWSLADHPPTGEERQRLLSLAASLVLDLLGSPRSTAGDREARAAAQWVLAVIDALRIADRDAEVRPFAIMARRASGVQARLARAVESALLDAEVE